jgi:hypothetical protein
VSIDEAEIAILWLLTNEGDHGERQACEAVARFLKKQIKSRKITSLVRKLGYESGLGTEIVRETETFKRAVKAINDELTTP